jgi:BON domain
MVGLGIQQGTKVLGGAISTVQGLTGRGGGQQEEQEQQQPSRAQQQRQRQQRAASERRSSRQPKDLDDVSITRKVETELFRSNDVQKGKIDVNTADGIVWLRGEAKNPEQVKELEAKAAAIPEVKRVENLLHLPKTPASTRADAPRRQQRTRSSTRRPTPRREEPRGAITNDRTDDLAPQAEPSPTEHAAEGEGRSPAPFGSSEGESSGPGPGDSGA